ncbi:DNA-directed RNA polymerase subunit beta [Nocardia sp. BMG51109]|uniref:DNA-directed RNA polymerase subunit beta n=1 Tax=Nocardia sp. BMG51109 TaxID=1056816 RepID=UPI001E4C8FFC|nr:DNA-directed RNA polymerase subunit beta [Nocardia sp. BMG51109]
MWGLTMPSVLGQRVKTDLRGRDVEIGPIVSHPRSKRWTYLIRPDLPDEVRLFAELFRLNVSVVRTGGEIALPSPADHQYGFRTWVERPTDSYRPSGLIVVDSIRRLTQPGTNRKSLRHNALPQQ